MSNEYYCSRYLRLNSWKQLCFACSMQPTCAVTCKTGLREGRSAPVDSAWNVCWASWVATVVHLMHVRTQSFLQRYHKVAYVKTNPLTDSYLPLRQFRPQNYLRKTIRLPELLKVISLLELLTLRQLRYHRLTDVKTIPLPQSYLR